MHYGSAYEDEIVGKAYDRGLMLRFIRYVHPYRWLALAALVLLPLSAAARLAQPLVLKAAIDDHIVTGRLEGLPLVAAGFLLLIVAESLITFLEVWLLQYLGQRVMLDLRLELFAHVQRLPVSFFDRTATGGLVTRLTSDVEVLGEMFAAGIITVVGDILFLAGIVGVMLWLNPPLSLITFSVLPLLVWVAFTFRIRMRKAFREVRARLANLNTFLAETIGGMSVIQLFNRQAGERAEFSRLNGSYRDANLPVITWDASLYALVETLSSVAVGLIIWYGGGEVLRGALTFGALVAFIQYIEKFFGPIRDLSAKYSIMQGAMAALERIFGLLDTAPDHDAGVSGPAVSAGAPPIETIRFRNVWFAYQEDDYVLRGIDLTIRRGETVALVGETGGGKTTVTRLLSRFYDVNRGDILFNGDDVRSIPLSELRRRIGVVLQDPYLFTGTVGFNIHLGDERARARMDDAARLVGADRFIRLLPGGYDEQVRERGSNLSAGERQLISFARAVAFDPEILVLDEATASIDTESERLIQDGLAALMAGRTSIVVAHRLSTVQGADRIVVIHRGEKVEEGTHGELLAQGGIYARLYQLQFRD
ncbi:ABC transporter ATP-binding protein [Geobacter sulfurreducens]|jgi:ATP-binding cassette subfamily B multidrug efflux pump|uniref:ABC transporter, ATP-binding/membrane protein n=1 Tax=Geobacter sulfurreducens (strain ATCC 51573 / DSM 12127 / PCA) TaxID=243231 RepID=Q74GZ2_GEOSL|nr:ABC transporter ATP-binding protein [Geobacter sulfurreducens]AAR33436.1 ABC transporter, ATP-binding/membrane protein [Geobacter sulfurreducens PCA]ADI82939.1 ABC transporter, ATP-binding/membrane protein [Geobacter sulfurreducens KN400]AJY69840.1 antibiotic ABC transporter ATP-binding protein [Geobacter sulfurreducens]QVW35380.1 ABC transporter ATP-binding protein [Geobacter sulfurreducens]UAC04204.1 ABC transporter ATP-binding protein/permease [Geobacter sulfurreducens]